MNMHRMPPIHQCSTALLQAEVCEEAWMHKTQLKSEHPAYSIPVCRAATDQQCYSQTMTAPGPGTLSVYGNVLLYHTAGIKAHKKHTCTPHGLWTHCRRHRRQALKHIPTLQKDIMGMLPTFRHKTKSRIWQDFQGTVSCSLMDLHVPQTGVLATVLQVYWTEYFGNTEAAGCSSKKISILLICSA